MKQLRIIITAIFLLCLFLSQPVAAQSEQRSPWSFTFDGGGAHQSETDLSDSSGSFAADRWYLGAGVNYASNPRQSFGLSFGVGRNIYEFSDDTGFGGGEPWGTVEDARLTFTSRFAVGERGMAFIVPTIRLNGEKGASNSDSRTYGIFGAIAWQLRENLLIGPGIGVFTRLEDSARIFPILAIDWQFADRWSISTGGGLASSRGPGLTLSYQVSEEWSLGIAGRYEDQEFRLDNDGIAPGGVGRDQSLPIVFTAAMQAGKQLNFSVFAGVSLGGNLRLKDANDIVIEETDYDVAPIFGGTFEFRF
jgi:hypothetical protein